MPLLTFLHIITMFLAVALTLGPQLLLQSVARTGDIRGIRSAFRAGRTFGQLSPIVFLVGAVFGILAALLGQINLLTPWLLIAYVLFIAASGAGSVTLAPWARRVGMAAAASPEDKPSPDLESALRDPRGNYGLWLHVTLIALVVFDMVLKPFS